MSYTADAYNAATPVISAGAGNMYLELQALKARVTSQVGGAAVQNIGQRVATAEATIADPTTGLAVTRSELTALVSTVNLAKGDITSLKNLTTTHSSQIESLNASLAGVSTGMSSLNAGIATNTQSLQGTQAKVAALEGATTQLSSQLQALAARVATLEAQP